MNVRRFLALMLMVILVYAGITLYGDVRRLGALLASYAWWTFAASLGLASMNYALRFVKWQYYLRKLSINDVPWTESLTVFLAGFVMSVTPAKAGEVFKSALLASARAVPIARSAPIVVADRLTDLVSLILLVAIGGFYFPGGLVPAAVASAMVAPLMAFVLSRTLGEAALSVVERLPAAKRVAPKLREAYASLRILAAPSALLIPTSLSVVAWGCEALGLWVILRGLGQPATIPVAGFVYSTATIAGAVAMLPGGVGGTEFTMITLLRRLSAEQITEAGASAATLLVRLATLWFAVLVGAVAWGVFRRRYDRGLDATPREG